jgi:hypothetical protein
MSHRLLPAAVFLACVVFGFGVGFEADGQSTDKPGWALPDWELPWGMSWPEPGDPALSGEGESTLADGASGTDTPTDPDDASADATEHAGATGPEPSIGPGVFPGLVNPPPPSTTSDAPVEGDGAVASSLTAQLAQLRVLEEQLRTMTEVSRAARATMEAALAGTPVQPEEPVEPATPEQIEASLELLMDMVKKMKPSKAAELLQEWDDKLAIGIFRRLGSRRATPILSKMPAAVGGRLTSKIAAGLGALPQVTADGAEASPQGEVQ